MASGTKGPLQGSGSAATASTSQLQRAGQQEAAADGWCSICLDIVHHAAYIDTCLHTFCLACIQQWAASRAACPLCRQPFSRVLRTVRVDDDYQEYVVGSSARRQRTAARQRVRSGSPQRRYNLRPRPNNEPNAGRRGPAGRHRAAPRTSNASTQQAAGEHPASPADGPVLHSNILALRARLMVFMDLA
ncbi:E3 ubiquitin-protein ligase Topors-like [Chroicocephalus ridibundus]|uniref:E3 ubiquitin-protein ligase Topors-like n=1 Tax=Chroicocephalus ridibundus TaxID=1192867 RepID=UPI002FDEF7B5